MIHRLAPLAASFSALLIVYFVGVVFFFEPVLAADTPRAPLAHPAVGLFLSTFAYIVLFEWVRRQMGSALKAALAIAASQFLLVDFDFVLSGNRGFKAAGASAILLLVGWVAVGVAYNLVALSRSRIQSGLAE